MSKCKPPYNNANIKAPRLQVAIDSGIDKATKPKWQKNVGISPQEKNNLDMKTLPIGSVHVMTNKDNTEFGFRDTEAAWKVKARYMTDNIGNLSSKDRVTRDMIDFALQYGMPFRVNKDGSLTMYLEYSQGGVKLNEVKPVKVTNIQQLKQVLGL